MHYFISLLFVGLVTGNILLNPRMIFKDLPFKRLHLKGDNTHIGLLQDHRDQVTVAGQKYLNYLDFQKDQHYVKRPHFAKECGNSDPISPCGYNITAAHRSKNGQTFVCGTNGESTECCMMNTSNEDSECTPAGDLEKIKPIVKEGEPSVLITSSGTEQFYTTYSGTQGSVGIYRHGENKIRPKSSGKEQRYVSLVVSQKRDNRQDKLYAFYVEKNTDQNVDSDLWVPFVSQVCLTDHGGHKNTLQFMWTSQLSAQLSCRDPISHHHFNNLLDVTTLQADKWQDHMVYALFSNGWNMSAVCVYKMGDIDRIFTTSSFKGYKHKDSNERPGMCVDDSTNLSRESLILADNLLVMEDRVKPLGLYGPTLVSHRHYTHIHVDRVLDQHTVLFLSLENGAIHKVLLTNSEAFLIAEYQPFSHRARVLNMMVHATSRKLYVSSVSEVAQVDLESCGLYGDLCQDCILSRDPYCGWNGTHCIPATTATKQDVENGTHHVNHNICIPSIKEYFPSKVQSPSNGEVRGCCPDDREIPTDDIRVPLSSKYYLQCPTKSNHAEYSWHQPGTTNSTPCVHTESQCLLLIESMGPEQEGTYSCVSEERGYRRTLGQYQLQVGSEAVQLTSFTLAWVCQIVMLIQTPCG